MTMKNANFVIAKIVTLSTSAAAEIALGPVVDIVSFAAADIIPFLWSHFVCVRIIINVEKLRFLVG